MFKDMDEDEKNFFQTFLDDIKKQIDDIKGHQAKTCDELDTVHREVVKIGADLKNHLKNESEKETARTQSKRSSRERISIIISAVSVSAAIASVIAIYFLK